MKYDFIKIFIINISFNNYIQNHKWMTHLIKINLKYSFTISNKSNRENSYKKYLLQLIANEKTNFNPINLMDATPRPNNN